MNEFEEDIVLIGLFRIAMIATMAALSVMKLMGLIVWSWWLILAPVWITMFVLGSGACLVLMLVAIGMMTSERGDR